MRDKLLVLIERIILVASSTHSRREREKAISIQTPLSISQGDSSPFIRSTPRATAAGSEKKGNKKKKCSVHTKDATAEPDAGGQGHEGAARPPVDRHRHRPRRHLGPVGVEHKPERRGDRGAPPAAVDLPLVLQPRRPAAGREARARVVRRRGRRPREVQAPRRSGSREVRTVQPVVYTAEPRRPSRTHDKHRRWSRSEGRAYYVG